MLSALIMICAATVVTGECTEDNALTIKLLPPVSNFQQCFHGANTYAAQELHLKDGEWIQINCGHHPEPLGRKT